MIAGTGSSLKPPEARVARPAASYGLCINPVDRWTYPRINGRAKPTTTTHKRSRLHA